MRKIYLGLLVCGLLFFVEKSEGQTASAYVFSASAGTYNPITTGTEIFDLQDDDELTSAIPIGFNFTYCGVPYSQIQACSNGWLSFVTTQATAQWTNSLTNSNLLRPALYPLWDDLDGFFDGQNFYETTGSSPNRVFTFEWRTFDWQVGASNNVISFQVKLYESTNIIQYIYRQEATTPFSPSGTIGIAGTASGDYLTLNNSSTSPTASSSTFTININNRPATGQVYQFAPPACTAPPTPGTTVSSANPVCYNTSFNLSISGASGGSGITYQWQSSPDGVTWTNIGSATAAAYTTSILTTTWFRRSITCSGNTTNSTGLQVVVQRPSTSVTPGAVCVNSSSVLTASAAAGTTTIMSENFNGVPTGWTTTNNTTGGSTPANAAWTLRPDGYMNTGGTIVFTFHSNDNSQFYLTNSDAVGSGSPVISTILQSPSFSTVGYTSCSLQFYHHYKDFSLDAETAKVEVSTNGTAWTTLQTYSAADQGTAAGFVLATIDLTAYINNATVYIRFKYDALWDWFWAVDNVMITGTSSVVTYSWTASPVTGAGLSAAAGVASAANNSITVTPATPGIFSYTVTSSNACLSPATVNVTASAGSLVSASACQTKTIISGDNYFVNAGCNLFTKIVAQGAVPVTGSVNACVTIDGTVQFYHGQPYLQRHYDIEPATNPTNSTARITLYATQAEFDAVNTADALLGNNWPDFPTGPGDALGISFVKVTQWHGTATASPSSPGTYPDPNAIYMSPFSVTWDAANSRWEIVIDVVGFSGFYIHTGFGFALPTNLTNFNGRREANGNLLNWTVTTEQNIRGYSIERSYDGMNFTSIGFVNSLAAGGNSNTVLQYHFTDNNFIGDKQYYRLKQTAFDGRIANSPVVLIKSARASLFTISSIFPNPANDVVSIMLESPVQDKLSIIVTDINGRVVVSKNVMAGQGTNTFPLNVAHLTAGTYIIKITCASGCESAVCKFIKQ